MMIEERASEKKCAGGGRFDGGGSVTRHYW